MLCFSLETLKIKYAKAYAVLCVFNACIILDIELELLNELELSTDTNLHPLSAKVS